MKATGQEFHRTGFLTKINLAKFIFSANFANPFWLEEKNVYASRLSKYLSFTQLYLSLTPVFEPNSVISVYDLAHPNQACINSN